MPTNISIPALDADGSIPAYRAAPTGRAKAAIIVIPEIFGVNPGIAAKCDSWAQLGYLAIAPDIFWRTSPGSELNPEIQAEFQQALSNMMQFEANDGVRDIEALIKYIRGQEGVGMVGVIGFCLGGKLAYMAAARTDADACVGYYGVSIDEMLGEAHAIARPLLLHMPTADHFVRPEAQKAIHDALDSHPRVTIHDYEGLDHGFAAEMGSRRNEEGAQLADSRSRAFFAEHLR